MVKKTVDELGGLDIVRLDKTSPSNTQLKALFL